MRAVSKDVSPLSRLFGKARVIAIGRPSTRVEGAGVAAKVDALGRPSRARAWPCGARSRVHVAADRNNVVLLAVLWIAMAIIVNPVGDFPLNDDWVYGLAVRSILEGHLQIPSFSSANVGPQLYWGALFCLPFGFSFTALRLSTLVLGYLGVLGVYALFRELHGSRRAALIGALTLLVNPIYFALANSFMTDVPFIALVVPSLYLIVRGMQRDERTAVWCGLGIALVAVLLRQLALVVLVGFACATVAKEGFRSRTILKAVTPLAFGLAAHFGFSLWLLETGRKPFPPGINGVSPVSILSFARTSLHESFVALVYLGWYVVPLILACLLVPALMRLRSREYRKSHAALVIVVLGLGAVLAFRAEEMPLSQNILTYFGIGPLPQRDTLLLFENLPAPPPWVHGAWLCVTAFSVVAAAVLLVVLPRGARHVAKPVAQDRRLGLHRAWKATFFASVAASYLCILLLIANRYMLYDRYLLLLMILASLSIPWLQRNLRWDTKVTAAGTRLAAISLIGCALFSIVATHDYLAWNRARWLALRDLVEVQHVSPRQIDGGYEFNGWFLYDATYDPHDWKSWWWVDDDIYMLASGRLPGYEEIDRIAVRRWWNAGGSDVVILRQSRKAASTVD